MTPPEQSNSIPQARQDLFGVSITRTGGTVELYTFLPNGGPLRLAPDQAERIGLELIRMAAAATWGR